MTAYRFRALDTTGQETRGTREADSEKALRAQLREQGLFPVEVAAVAGKTGATGWRARIRTAELVLLTRQWATLLGAGLTLEQSLSALIEQADREPLRQLLTGVRSEVRAGFSLHAALDLFPQVFPRLYRASVAAGEQSGQLAQVMWQLADYLERSHQLRVRTLQSLLYPVIVAVVALLVIIGLMTYVVPQVIQVFQHSRQALPWLTRALVWCSQALRQWGWLLVLLGLGLEALRHALLRQARWRRPWDAFWLRLPLIGRHLRTLESTRFASTLAILTSSGVPLLVALEAGRQVMHRLPMLEAIDHVTERVRTGAPLSRALQETGLFPPLLVHMVANGEATGRVGELLERAARVQQTELENRTAALTTVLEPLLLLLMGGFVMLIVLAVMQPIIEINTLLT